MRASYILKQHNLPDINKKCIVYCFQQRKLWLGLYCFNKMGSKKDAWLPRANEWLELTSGRSLSPSFPPKQTGCIYGSVDITWALYLCGHKAASCAAFVQHAEDSQDPQRSYCLVILHLAPHVAD